MSDFIHLHRPITICNLTSIFVSRSSYVLLLLRLNFRDKDQNTNSLFALQDLKKDQRSIPENQSCIPPVPFSPPLPPSASSPLLRLVAAPEADRLRRLPGDEIID